MMYPRPPSTTGSGPATTPRVSASSPPYANGVNAYIDTHAGNLPVEFRLTGIRPGRWTKETVVRRWTGLFFPSAGNDAGG